MKQVITLSIFVSVFVMGCGSIKTIDNPSSKAQAHQSKQAQTKKANKKAKPNNNARQVAQTISSQCHYIIRDLSIPHATTIWCMPKRGK